MQCNKCLIQIKSQIILDYSCATDSEQPSYISTMSVRYVADLCVAQGVDHRQEESKLFFYGSSSTCSSGSGYSVLFNV